MITKTHSYQDGQALTNKQTVAIDEAIEVCKGKIKAIVNNRDLVDFSVKVDFGPIRDGAFTITSSPIGA